MMTQPIRFAMCGTGWVAQMHARSIAAVPGVELVAVHNHRQPSLDEFTADHPAPVATTDWDEFLAAAGDGCADVAVVATPNVRHAPQSIALMRAGVHVLVEKPMAVSVEEAEEMAAVADETGRALMTGHMWRFDPEARWLRQEIAAGALGRIIRTRSLSVHTWWGPSGWFQQRALAGGGALADMGVHAIDTTRYLIGDPRPVRVTARIGTYYGDYDVDDTAVLLIDWDNDTTSVVEAGWWQVQCDGPEAATRLHGTRAFGSLFPTLVTRELQSPESGGSTFEERTPPPFDRAEHCDPRLFEAQIAHAADVARGTTSPENGPDVGLTAVRIMEASYRSARTGQEVTLA
ncbi:MAG: Gfo/Idh/MocA family oxidoreductase [bacterium]|nr:Gfo/Idh/MocA family oxidoreductase [bacterium]